MENSKKLLNSKQLLNASADPNNSFNPYLETDLDEICTSVSQRPVNPLYSETLGSPNKIVLPKAKLLEHERFWREQVNMGEPGDIGTSSADTFTPHKKKLKLPDPMKNWWISLSGEDLLIVGMERVGRPTARICYRRVSSKIFYDKNFTVCSLCGPIQPHEDIPPYVLEKFRLGLPPDWKSVIKLWRHFKLLDSPVKFKWPSTESSQKNHHLLKTYDTDTDNDINYSSLAADKLRRKINKMEIRYRAMILKENYNNITKEKCNTSDGPIKAHKNPVNSINNKNLTTPKTIINNIVSPINNNIQIVSFHKKNSETSNSDFLKNQAEQSESSEMVTLNISPEDSGENLEQISNVDKDLVVNESSISSFTSEDDSEIDSENIVLTQVQNLIKKSMPPENFQISKEIKTDTKMKQTLNPKSSENVEINKTTAIEHRSSDSDIFFNSKQNSEPNKILEITDQHEKNDKIKSVQESKSKIDNKNTETVQKIKSTEIQPSCSSDVPINIPSTFSRINTSKKFLSKKATAELNNFKDISKTPNIEATKTKDTPTNTNTKENKNTSLTKNDKNPILNEIVEVKKLDEISKSSSKVDGKRSKPPKHREKDQFDSSQNNIIECENNIDITSKVLRKSDRLLAQKPEPEILKSPPEINKELETSGSEIHLYPKVIIFDNQTPLPVTSKSNQNLNNASSPKSAKNKTTKNTVNKSDSEIFLKPLDVGTMKKSKRKLNSKNSDLKSSCSEKSPPRKSSRESDELLDPASVEEVRKTRKTRQMSKSLESNVKFLSSFEDESRSTSSSQCDSNVSLRGRRRVPPLPFWQGHRLTTCKEETFIETCTKKCSLANYTNISNSLSVKKTHKDSLSTNTSSLSYEKVFNKNTFEKPKMNPVQMQLMSTLRDSFVNISNNETVQSQKNTSKQQEIQQNPNKLVLNNEKNANNVSEIQLSAKKQQTNRPSAKNKKDNRINDNLEISSIKTPTPASKKKNNLSQNEEIRKQKVNTPKSKNKKENEIDDNWDISLNKKHTPASKKKNNSSQNEEINRQKANTSKENNKKENEINDSCENFSNKKQTPASKNRNNLSQNEEINKQKINAPNANNKKENEINDSWESLPNKKQTPASKRKNEASQNEELNKQETHTPKTNNKKENEINDNRANLSKKKRTPASNRKNKVSQNEELSKQETNTPKANNTEENEINDDWENISNRKQTSTSKRKNNLSENKKLTESLPEKSNDSSFKRSTRSASKQLNFKETERHLNSSFEKVLSVVLFPLEKTAIQKYKKQLSKTLESFPLKSLTKKSPKELNIENKQRLKRSASLKPINCYGETNATQGEFKKSTPNKRKSNLIEKSQNIDESPSRRYPTRNNKNISYRFSSILKIDNYKISEKDLSRNENKEQNSRVNRSKDKMDSEKTNDGKNSRNSPKKGTLKPINNIENSLKNDKNSEESTYSKSVHNMGPSKPIFKVPKPKKIKKDLLPTDPNGLYLFVNKLKKSAKRDATQTSLEVKNTQSSSFSSQKKRKLFSNENWIQSEECLEHLSQNNSENEIESPKFVIKFNSPLKLRDFSDDMYSEVSAFV